MNQNPSFITTCSEDEDGNVVLDIPEELLDALGWKEGTELSVEAFAGAIILRECTEPQVDGGLSQQMR
jgi:antitoxin component of MazEF toxin-antitoxin module